MQCRDVETVIMGMRATIETKRLLVREFIPDDLYALQEILGDAETMKNCEPAYDVDKTRDFLETFCIGRKGALAAVHKDTGRLIGYILFKEYEEDVYEIGWIFNKKYWRQGYAYECCSEVIRYAFDELNAHKVFAEAIDGVKSVGLMKKLGMKQEGIQRKQTRDNDGNWADMYIYGILKEEACFG